MMRNERVIEVTREGDDIYTIKFNSDFVAAPGQFLMIWIPGGKEVPMSLSSVSNPFSITFKVYGETTRSLSALRKGERIFFRGPYGNSYPEPKGKIAYVAGGTGLASLNSMITKYKGDVYVGARTSKDLFLLGTDFRIATDDGSLGLKGNVVDLFKGHINEYDYIYVCGPEPMEKALLDEIKNTKAKVYFSLERLMKCGIGICDSCSINGFRVCRDGPVVEMNYLRNLDEFGRIRRSESGKMEFISNPKR
ncbi:MAG: dihydroorotate dehydrogenase electron transfer subunit [Thermoplasmatales archaeon]